MSKFKNKLTGEIVEANNFTELFAFSHNSNYESLIETKKIKTKNKEDNSDNEE